MKYRQALTLCLPIAIIGLYLTKPQLLQAGKVLEFERDFYKMYTVHFFNTSQNMPFIQELKYVALEVLNFPLCSSPWNLCEGLGFISLLQGH